ncbi:TPA: hypothetical protein RJX18_001752 [Legionella pneumophila]|uniref:hypothetical protein n=1 Tax=Legionella pneumophila TaxID=446 RepID=UPI0001E3C77A|nr:hypothetical protein [Legionella pneumophila]MDC8031083.1 hypothetical protein [Legionella pneumophila subsp. pneumophila]MDW8870415.1 hypothetical protein [Legionella pneumophila]MDW8916481.1 hypothetical protein [Legionella pneumophila]MDW8925306.1 hypothetical protein [Legionella pneumophila]MDW8931236.1 hypothetical protein [Legionella pneumophila]
MKKTFLAVLMFSGLNGGVYASAFCNGFEEGYKTIKGDMVIVPICPIEPITPIGSNSYREGIKAGIRAANED